MKEIPLTQGKVALVDDEDYPNLIKHKWCAQHSYNNVWYAIRVSPRHNGKQGRFHMHRIIMHPHPDMEIDHINGDGLDNRKTNLRVVTTRQNGQNRHQIKSSDYPGVSWHKLTNKWSANIEINGIKRHLGLFLEEEEAADAYRVACDHPDSIPLPNKKSSKYLGVSWCNRDRRWVAQIRINGIQRRIGSFINEIDAATAYQKARDALI